MSNKRVNVRKSKLAKAMNCEKAADRKNRYYPNQEEAKRWHRIINREIFDGQLVNDIEIEVRRRHGCFGEYTGENDRKKEVFYTLSISLNNWFLSKKHFIECIVHEMVHQYQWERLNELTHGKSFFAWQNKLQKYGMVLKEIQN